MGFVSACKLFAALTGMSAFKSSVSESVELRFREENDDFVEGRRKGEFLGLEASFVLTECCVRGFFLGLRRGLSAGFLGDGGGVRFIFERYERSCVEFKKRWIQISVEVEKVGSALTGKRIRNSAVLMWNTPIPRDFYELQDFEFVLILGHFVHITTTHTHPNQVTHSKLLQAF